MGKAMPGHTIDIVTDEGVPVADGQPGNIGVKRPHPVMMLRYWRKEKATQEKYAGEYLITGDLAKRDSDGYFTFFGRRDDVIKTSGYRVGPAEIEDCLMRHPAVSNVAAIGVPDELRGEIVKVYIMLRPETKAKLAAASSADQRQQEEAALRTSIAAHVKGKLAAYEYPREIEFIDDLPMTTTGKVIRKDLKTRHMQERGLQPKLPQA